MITHYKVVFKSVAACAFSQNYIAKEHLFWFQNFHVFLKFKCSFLNVNVTKKQQKTILYM